MSTVVHRSQRDKVADHVGEGVNGLRMRNMRNPNIGNDGRGVHQHAQHGFGAGEHDVHSKSPVRHLLHFLCLHDGIVDVSPVITVKPLRNLNPHVEYSSSTLQYLDESALV